jgi:hypothetical protein
MTVAGDRDVWARQARSDCHVRRGIDGDADPPGLAPSRRHCARSGTDRCSHSVRAAAQRLRVQYQRSRRGVGLRPLRSLGRAEFVLAGHFQPAEDLAYQRGGRPRAAPPAGLLLRLLGSAGSMADIGASVGDLHLATVVINVQDMTRAVKFWTAALGYVPREHDWDPEFMTLVDPARRRLPVLSSRAIRRRKFQIYRECCQVRPRSGRTGCPRRGRGLSSPCEPPEFGVSHARV